MFCVAFALALIITAGLPLHALAQPPAGEPRIAFAARTGQNWDIYSIRPDGTDLRRLTDHPEPDLAPAFSPDGSQLLFQSHRDGNWEIYLLDLHSGELTRLTDSPAFDGMPAWAPDGRRFAFESTRAGDLDIFIGSLDGGPLQNLTADSPYGDMEPAWSPDGSTIAFSSWRYGDKDLFFMRPDGQDVRQITNSPTGEDQPAWSPDGIRLTFTYRTPEKREVTVLEVMAPPAEGGLTTRLTWSTANEWAVWSPDGRSLAWLEQYYNGWALHTAPLTQTAVLPAIVLRGYALAGPLSWSDRALPFGQPAAAESLDHPWRTRYAMRWEELQPIAGGDSDAGLAGWMRVQNVDVPNERLNALVAPSFIQLREAVKQAAGFDFLARLSDAWRPLDEDSETTTYASWHKAGRAIDTLFDYRDRNGFPMMAVVREDIGGRTYWRVYLRAARQDGSLGMPLREPPWDFSGNARRRFPEQGGRWDIIPPGYYVDFTDLASSFGWERIASVDKADFSWTWHFLAIEYWHFQQDENMDWYASMRQVYPLQELAPLFNWRTLQKNDIPDWYIVLTGIPIPLSEHRWSLLHP